MFRKRTPEHAIPPCRGTSTHKFKYIAVWDVMFCDDCGTVIEPPSPCVADKENTQEEHDDA